MVYKIEFAATAKKQFGKLPDATRRRLVEALDRLSENPRHSGTLKLAGGENLYRTRTGDYRIVYRIEDHRLLVLVVKIGHRSDIYR